MTMGDKVRRLTAETVAITVELQQMLYDLGHVIDARCGDGIADFYCADGAFVICDIRYQGRAEIEAFYLAERERIRTSLKDGRRQLLHAFVNPRVLVADDHRSATILSTNINFSHEGAPPIEGPIAANLIVDCQLDCRLEDDGHWRITEFRSTSGSLPGPSPTTVKSPYCQTSHHAATGTPLSGE